MTNEENSPCTDCQSRRNVREPLLTLLLLSALATGIVYVSPYALTLMSVTTVAGGIAVILDAAGYSLAS